jgi:type I restriction enzyme S subunit
LLEQKRIARILNDQLAAVEKARQAAQGQLDAASDLPESYIRDSLSNGGVKRYELAECLEEVKHGIGSRWSDYPLLGATREGVAPAKEGVGKHPERYKPVDALTVFYNPMRILLGSIAFVDEDDAPGITSPDYVVLKGKDKVLHSRWFYYWFRSSYGISLIQSLSRGAVRERILFNRLSNGQIDLPDWKTQLKTVKALKAIDGLKKKISEQIETINAAPSLLLKKAFEGEL